MNVALATVREFCNCVFFGSFDRSQVAKLPKATAKTNLRWPHLSKPPPTQLGNLGTVPIGPCLVAQAGEIITFLSAWGELICPLCPWATVREFCNCAFFGSFERSQVAKLPKARAKTNLGWAQLAVPSAFKTAANAGYFGPFWLLLLLFSTFATFLCFTYSCSPGYFCYLLATLATLAPFGSF